MSIQTPFPAGAIHPLLRKIGRGFDRLKGFRSERNNGVYCRTRKALQAFKDPARAQRTGEIFGLAIASFLCGLPAELFADTVEIQEWLVPWQDAEPGRPYVDDRGRAWFASNEGNFIANLSLADNEFNRYDQASGLGPVDLLVDAAGHVWFSIYRKDQLGKLDPGTGGVTILEMPVRKARGPYALAFDPAGDIWFTLRDSNSVGKLDIDSGAITLLPLPAKKVRPDSLVVAADGNVWVAGSGSSSLFNVPTNGDTIEETPLPGEDARPVSLASTSAEAIWYVDHAQGRLGRFNPQIRQFTEWPMPGGSGSKPFGMTSDRDGRIWIVETGLSPSRLVGFDSAAEIFLTETDIPSGAGTVRSLRYHEPAGEIWFGTETNYIGRAKIH